MVAPLAVAPAACAHLRSGTIAVDYRARLTAPTRRGFTARVMQSDRALSISVQQGHSVVVLGYLGEPFLRLDAAGLAVNAASPTSVGAGVLKKDELASGSKAVWRLDRGRRSVVWHDARVQGLPPGVGHGAWEVPLVVDGRRTLLTGELVRLPAPALWPWAIVATLLAGATTVLALGRRPRALHISSVGVGVVAAIAATATALGFALDAYASPGTWIAGLDELVFIAVGLGVLAWGPRKAHAWATIGLGLVSSAVGLSNGPVFFHAIVLSVIPSATARALVAAAIGAGVAAAVLGALSYTSPARTYAGRSRNTPARRPRW